MALNASLLSHKLPFCNLHLSLSLLQLLSLLISLHIDHIRLILISLLQSDQRDGLVSENTL